MRKLENKRMSLLWCGLLCALLMSGCSGMLQSLADGTDAVLGGLANGADQVTGALADMTDAALDAAADATDDSVKDAILDAYSSLVDTVGSWALTLEGSLQGERVPGEDDYTGTYAADYEDFSGTELLFGGTTLDREAGDTVESKRGRPPSSCAPARRSRCSCCPRAGITPVPSRWAAEASISASGAKV